MNKVLLLTSAGLLFGPFPDQETATQWTGSENGRTHIPTAELQAVKYLQFNTAAIDCTTDTANECGTLLTSIEGASESATPIRQARRA